jgi:omega-6 fatty acid desaturase (delta-12 desaturase)
MFAGALLLSPLWPRILCSLALGPLVALLFRVAHDAGHGCHFGSRRMNRVIGRLSILPSYHPFSVWLLFHNGLHHGFTNLKGRDYIWVPLTKAEYDGLTAFGRARERFYRSTAGFGVYYLWTIWWKKMVWLPRLDTPSRERLLALDRLLVAGFFCVQLALLGALADTLGGFAVNVLLAMVMPFLAFSWMVGFVSFFNHTHPCVPWFARTDQWSFFESQVNCTVHMSVPCWLFFFITDLGLHGAHHIDPRIPIWRLERAEHEIVRQFARTIPSEHWTLRRHRWIIGCCKLYDYEAHRWLDFAGRTTAQPTATRQPAVGLPAR